MLLRERLVPTFFFTFFFSYSLGRSFHDYSQAVDSFILLVVPLLKMFGTKISRFPSFHPLLPPPRGKKKRSWWVPTP